MKQIEEIVEEKISSAVNSVLCKIFKPDITVDKVCELNEKEIENIKKIYGIEGIILDVDDTLRKNMGAIPKCNQNWIENLKGQLKVIVVSNGIDGRMEEYFGEKGIDYIEFAHKPLKKNFVKACEQMNLTPEKVMVIGDSLFCDIYGGKRNNMKTALVKSVENNER